MNNVGLRLKANRCFISADDCERAFKYLEACQELEEIDLQNNDSFYYLHREGLLVAAIVFYAKAFKKSSGGENSAKLVDISPDEIFGSDQKKMELHRAILQERDKAVAHSDSEYYRTELEKVVGSVSYRKGVEPYFVNRIDVGRFIEIAKDMCAHFRKQGLDIDLGRSGEAIASS